MSERERARRRRAVFRQHHPDVGGDRRELIRQLVLLEQDAAVDDYPEVSFGRRPRWTTRARQVRRAIAALTGRIGPHRPRRIRK